jgi:hypothetical protein
LYKIKNREILYEGFVNNHYHIPIFTPAWIIEYNFAWLASVKLVTLLTLTLHHIVIIIYL